MKLAIIIPVYNEGATLERFLALLAGWLPASDSWHVVLVDDGSTPLIDARSPVVHAELHLLRHSINLGQGAALQTGITYARDVLGVDTFITMDADGQHRPEDIPGLLEVMQSRNADIVFGNRFATGAPRTMPRLRHLILRAAIAFESVVTGVRLSDAHNGLRCFNATFAHALRLKQNRMAHATEFKQVVARARLRYAEAPVQIAYSPESLRKGQRNLGSLVILKDLAKVYLFNS